MYMEGGFLHMEVISPCRGPWYPCGGRELHYPYVGLFGVNAITTKIQIISGTYRLRFFGMLIGIFFGRIKTFSFIRHFMFIIFYHFFWGGVGLGAQPVRRGFGFFNVVEIS